MVGENLTPGAGQGIAGGQRAGAFGGAQGFDLRRFGTEVANEIGVDPSNLEQYGLSAQRIQQYETQLHSGTQRGGS